MLATHPESSTQQQQNRNTCKEIDTKATRVLYLHVFSKVQCVELSGPLYFLPDYRLTHQTDDNGVMSFFDLLDLIGESTFEEAPV